MANTTVDGSLRLMFQPAESFPDRLLRRPAAPDLERNALLEIPEEGGNVGVISPVSLEGRDTRKEGDNCRLACERGASFLGLKTQVHGSVTLVIFGFWSLL